MAVKSSHPTTPILPQHNPRSTTSSLYASYNAHPPLIPRASHMLDRKETLKVDEFHAYVRASSCTRAEERAFQRRLGLALCRELVGLLACVIFLVMACVHALSFVGCWSGMSGCNDGSGNVRLMNQSEIGGKLEVLSTLREEHEVAMSRFEKMIEHEFQTLTSDVDALTASLIALATSHGSEDERATVAEIEQLARSLRHTKPETSNQEASNKAQLLTAIKITKAIRPTLATKFSLQNGDAEHSAILKQIDEIAFKIQRINAHMSEMEKVNENTNRRMMEIM